MSPSGANQRNPWATTHEGGATAWARTRSEATGTRDSIRPSLGSIFSIPRVRRTARWKWCRRSRLSTNTTRARGRRMAIGMPGKPAPEPRSVTCLQSLPPGRPSRTLKSERAPTTSFSITDRTSPCPLRFLDFPHSTTISENATSCSWASSSSSNSKAVNADASDRLAEALPADPPAET